MKTKLNSFLTLLLALLVQISFAQKTVNDVFFYTGGLMSDVTVLVISKVKYYN